MGGRVRGSQLLCQNFCVKPCQESEIFFSLFKLNTEQWRIYPGGAPTPKMGVLTYFFGRKLHENERIWTPKGARIPGAPLRSATAEAIRVFINHLKAQITNTWKLKFISGGSKRDGPTCPLPRPQPHPKIFLISCSFWEILTSLYFGTPPMVGA